MNAILTVQTCDNFKSYASMYLDFVSSSWSKTIRYVREMIKKGEASIFPAEATEQEKTHAYLELERIIHQCRNKQDIVRDLNTLIDGLFIQIWEE